MEELSQTGGDKEELYLNAGYTLDWILDRVLEGNSPDVIKSALVICC